VKALSSEAWRNGKSAEGLTSTEGRLALLIGREKLKAGRGSWDPPVENSEDKDGERGMEGLVNGVKGEWARERLELGERFLFCRES
jgi:hypothetical protein